MKRTYYCYCAKRCFALFFLLFMSLVVQAFILNFRPEKMVELERAQGFDHSGNREVRV